MGLTDIITAMGSYVTMFFSAFGYLFGVVFNLPVGGVPLGYIVVVLLAISFVIGLLHYIIGGEE